MNGRCETDPLDQAVDVCDSCYGEFCPACLVNPKGRRHPICTECALIASGVRTGAQPERLGSRRSAKKRRAALREQAADEPKLFEYFDGVASGDAADQADNRDSEPEPTDDADQVETESESDSESESESETGSEPETPDPTDDPASATETAKGASDQSAKVEPTTPAVAKLNQIRQNEQRDRDGDPEPAAQSDPVSATATVPQSVVAKSTVIREPNPASRTNGSTPVSKPRPPVDGPHRRRSDQQDGDGADGRHATAPMIGEVRIIGGRRSTDVVEPEPDPQPASGEAENGAMAGSGAPNAVDQFDAGGRAVDTSSPKADTDASGNWIPPILRGMAPNAREAKATLPQRRKRDDD